MVMLSKKENRTDALSSLKDDRLLREHAYINGRWEAAKDGNVVTVRNPYDDSLLGYVPDMGVTETTQAIEAAQEAFVTWCDLLPQERAKFLRNWYDLIHAHKEDLALLITLEQGKPYAESLGEIDYAASFIEWYAEEGKRMNAESITPHLPNCTMMVRREPIGVTAAVTPWNFPSAMITRKAAAALAAGCTMVVRPASETPFSALALAELADRAGIPAGVFNVVTGDAKVIVGELCSNKLVRSLSFTGSTEVGRILLSQASQTVKKMSMELGGHAPFIIYPDVDIDEAVNGAIDAKFATTGQDCLAANRIYVHRDIYEDFIGKFTMAASAQTTGNGLHEGVDLGPLIHQGALEKCHQHVEDAIAKGARLLTGGTMHSLGGLFFPPTVLADVTPEMDIYYQETFGPVAGLVPFGDDDDIVAMANDSEYGLVAYLYTNDSKRTHRISAALNYGMVAVNTPKITGAPIPFGGVKQSGLGREGSRHGLEEFTELKYICIAN